MRFELSGDVLPDPTTTQSGGLPLAHYAASALPLPLVDRDYASPMLDYRGLQPFHDFPKGPECTIPAPFNLAPSPCKVNFFVSR